MSAEFNFYNDPEAAQYVLNHLNTAVTLVPMELCEANSFSWVGISDDVMGEKSTPHSARFRYIDI